MRWRTRISMCRWGPSVCVCVIDCWLWYMHTQGSRIVGGWGGYVNSGEMCTWVFQPTNWVSTIHGRRNRPGRCQNYNLTNENFCSHYVNLKWTETKVENAYTVVIWFSGKLVDAQGDMMVCNITFVIIFAVFDLSPLTLWINCSF